MRFLSFKPTKREAEEKATRTISVFAWWPIACDDGYTYWLCRVVIIKRAAFFYPNVPCWECISKMPPPPKLPKAQARTP